MTLNASELFTRNHSSKSYVLKRHFKRYHLLVIPECYYHAIANERLISKYNLKLKTNIFDNTIFNNS